MDTFRQKIVLITLAICLFMPLSVLAEKVGIFTSNEPYNSSGSVSISVPNGIVGLSGEVPIAGDSSVANLSSTSLFFMIDNSGSMFDKGKDPQGNRFRLIGNLIDTLAAQPDKFPGIECGLGVFGTNLYYDLSNSALLESLPAPFDSGAFLPLVELAKQYPSDGNKTGAEILKGLVQLTDSLKHTPRAGAVGEWWVPDTANYFKYNDGHGAKWFHNSQIGTTDTVTALRAKSSSGWESGTVIDYGFQAAIAAMKRSANPKKNQFIIFISDGESTNNDCADGTLNGGSDLIPTTFTIYFTTDTTAPAEIIKINDGIKSNGFSSANSIHTTVEAYHNTTSEKLIEHVMDSIVSVFAVHSKINPKKLTVNGVSGGTWSDTKGAFLYTHSFALTGVKTDFNFSLDVSIQKDSIDALGTHTSHIYDTTFNFVTEVLVDPTTTVGSLNGDVMWWDRELAVMNRGTAVTAISEVDDSLVLRFTYDQLGGTYTYTTVPLEIVTVNSKDTLQLNATPVGGNVFEVLLPVDYTGVMSSSDGLLTPDSTDTFICTFRNDEPHKLPLDTLQHSFSYARSAEISIESGSLHDRDADGILDEITVELSGDASAISKGAAEIVSNLQFPPTRGITVLSSTITGSTLSIGVTTTLGVTTELQFNDTLSVTSNVIISTGGVLQAGAISLEDKMAPVVTSAQLRKRSTNLYDSLTLTFSEPLDSITLLEPFLAEFLTGGTLLPKLIDKSSGSASHLFEIGRVDSDLISNGDSLSCNVVAAIEDAFSNGQTNPGNKRVPINVTHEEVVISTSEIRFTDPEGKGFPSAIEFDFTDTLVSSAKVAIDSILTEWVRKIPGRNLRVDSVGHSARGTILWTSETGAVFNTAIDLSDSFVVTTALALPAKYTWNAGALLPLDMMAPVATVAQLQKKSTNLYDTLSVTFSESIDSVAASNPLLVEFIAGGSLIPTVLDKSGGSVSHLFEIGRAESDKIGDGDSLSCNTVAALSDALGNGQTSLTNKRVPINVTHEYVGISISEIVFTDPAGKGFPSVIEVTLSDTATIYAKDSINAILTQWITSIPGRNLIVDSLGGTGNGVLLWTSETGAVYNTAVGAHDSLVMNSPTLLPDYYTLNAGAVLPIDKMAPVAIVADLKKKSTNLYDTLSVTFSESIDSIAASTPFLVEFIAGGSMIPTVLDKSNGSASHLLEIGRVESDKISNGDSLSCNIATAISDVLGNGQIVPANKRVPITISHENVGITISEVSFTDPSGKGYPSIIEVELTDTVSVAARDSISSVLRSLIQSIPGRNLIVDSVTGIAKDFHFNVSETGAVFNTAVEASDSFNLSTPVSLPNYYTLETSTVLPKDKMAPVVTIAQLKKKSTNLYDSLTVTFSESIDSVTFIKPLVVHVNKGGTAPSPMLVDLSGSLQSHIFLILRTESDMISAGDSLSCNIDAALSDAFGNGQISPINKRVPITISHENVGITISEVSFADPAGKGYPSVIEVTLNDTVSVAARDSINKIITHWITSIPGRNLKVDSLGGIGRDVILWTSETGAVFNTSVEASDSLVVHSLVALPNHYELNAVAILPDDEMAPVSVSAKLYDNALDGDDSLVVTFSESVASTIGTETFSFYSSTGSYLIDHSAKGSLNASGSFVLSKKDGDRVVAGDSLHFQVAASATDALGNVQLSPNNKKTVIEIVKPLQQIAIESVSFRDPLGQGNAFDILVTLSKELPLEMQSAFEKAMVDYIEHINNRQLTVDSIKWSGVTCQLLSSTGNPDFINTAILADDNLTISDTISLSNQVFIHGESITPIDNMAPVLVEAICLDSLVSDTVEYVEMRFSENISNSSSFTKEVPFYFFEDLGVSHPVELDFVSQANEVMITYPTMLKAGSFWASLDSVQISTGFGISDGLNSQVAPTNRKVPLRYEYVIAPLDLEIKASTITPLAEVGYITIGPKSNNALLSDEEISAFVTIVDNVGNTIINNQSTTFSNGVALLQWDGKNSIGRAVGSGNYLVIAEVQGGSRIDGSTYDKVELQTIMGVKR